MAILSDRVLTPTELRALSARSNLPGVIRSVRAMSLLMVGGSVVSVALFGWKTPFLYWIIAQLIGQPFLRAYLITEHTGCTLDAMA